MSDPTAAPGAASWGAGEDPVDAGAGGGLGGGVAAPEAPTTQFPLPDPLPAPEPPPTGAATADVAAPLPDSVTCPECGTAAVITVNRRESSDFCRQCDFPLFWTPSAIVRDTGRAGEDSLRRLPGTAGRVTVASVPCPHCSEPNLLGAQVCVRCGLPMRILAPRLLPEPAPVVLAPPPEPEPEEPEKHVPWWVWAMIAILLAATIALVIMGATGVIG